MIITEPTHGPTDKWPSAAGSGRQPYCSSGLVIVVLRKIITFYGKAAEAYAGRRTERERERERGGGLGERERKH